MTQSRERWETSSTEQNKAGDHETHENKSKEHNRENSFIHLVSKLFILKKLVRMKGVGYVLYFR